MDTKQLKHGHHLNRITSQVQIFYSKETPVRVSQASINGNSPKGKREKSINTGYRGLEVHLEA